MLLVLKKNKFLLLSIALYFVVRLINLTKPPLFNDEAIYLDWGYREIHKPGFLYYSLYDGKEPFLMWIFGILESFLNPIFAGRIVSVFAGFFTLIGLFKISELIFNKRIALLSTFFYAFIPIFSFYDRQALMESSIAAVGVWSFYFLINVLKNKNLKYSVDLGLVLGIGVFIKATSMIFFGITALIIVYKLIKGKNSQRLFDKLAIMVGSFTLSLFLLLVNPSFWSSIGSNSRYVLTLKEIFSFPINTWINSIVGNFQISFFYLTPLVFIVFLIGVLSLIKKQRLFLLFFLTALFAETFTIRNTSLRYIMPFLPFAVIPVSYFINTILEKNKLYGKTIFLILIIIPTLLTFFQVINQPGYILFISKLTPYYSSDYLSGFSSGYGVDQAINYIRNYSKQDISVTFAENAGNPESSIMTTFANNPHIQPAYLDSKLIGADLSEYSCLSTTKPLIFIARDSQQGGLDKFLVKIGTIKNPYGQNTIGIYEIKKDCKGKTLTLSPQDNSKL